MQYSTAELLSQEVSKLRSDSVSTVHRGQAPNLLCFLHPPLLYPKLPYTERPPESWRPHHDLLWAGRSVGLCAPREHSQVDKALRQSVAPFPWCSMEEGRKARPAPCSGHEVVAELSPLLSTLHIHNVSAKRDYCSCPLTPTKTHTTVSCARSTVVCVPKRLCKLPPRSALSLANIYVPFTYQHLSLFEVWLCYRRRGRTQGGI